MALSAGLPRLDPRSSRPGHPDREETGVNDTIVTLQGYVGGSVTLRAAGETVVAGFRLGSTPRHFNRTSQEWVDDQTQWFTVSAWRALGENCAASLHVGDAVVVHGRMRVSTWVDGNGVERETWEIVATTVGHDLTRGTSTFVKPPKAAPVEDPAPPAPAGEEVAA